MILFNLKCAKEHVFEGWFRNGDAYEDQAEARAISCPVCGSRKVEKAVMAPRIGKSGGKSGETERAPDGGEPRSGTDLTTMPDAEKAVQLRRALEELRSKVEAQSDFVGDRFAEEARRIHYGEVEARSIHGRTSDDEAEALREEGVPFARVPWLPRQDS